MINFVSLGLRQFMICANSLLNSKIQYIISHNIMSHNVLYLILNYSFQLQLMEEEESLTKKA